MSKTTIDFMAAAIQTFKQRSEQYGESYKRHGEVMRALFPEGLTICGVEEFNRFGILNMIVSKLLRYTNDWHNPHEDSIHDLGVYAFINQELDMANREPTKGKQK